MKTNMNIEETIERNNQAYATKCYWMEKVNEYCKTCGDYGFGCRGLKNKDTDGGKCDCWVRD